RGLCIGHSHAQCFGDTFTVCRFTCIAITDMAVFDEIQCIPHRAGSVIEQGLFLFIVHQVEQGSWLAEIIVVVLAIIPEIRITGNFQWGFSELWLFLPLAESVWLIMGQ